MSIIWKYLDKKAGAIAALKDYDSMKFIIDNTDADIKNTYHKMAGIGSPGFDGMPHSKTPQAAESRVTSCIDEIDVLKERYRQATEYMSWFVPAWRGLTPDERYVLDMFFCKQNDYGDAVADIEADHYQIERASAYRRKCRAVDKLTVLLFGK